MQTTKFKQNFITALLFILLAVLIISLLALSSSSNNIFTAFLVAVSFLAICAIITFF